MSPTSPATTTSAVSVAGKAPAPEVAPAAPLQAILVIHGIGQQQPFQPLDNFGNGLRATLVRAGQSVTTTHLMFGREEVFDHCVRIEASGMEGGTPSLRLDIYEFYWAPLTQGKASFGQIVRWLAATGFTPVRRLAFNLPLLIQRVTERATRSRVAAAASPGATSSAASGARPTTRGIMSQPLRIVAGSRTFWLCIEFAREVWRLAYVSLVAVSLAGLAVVLVGRSSALAKQLPAALGPALSDLMTWRGAASTALALVAVIAALGLGMSIPEQIRDLVRLQKIQPRVFDEIRQAARRGYHAPSRGGVFGRFFAGAVAAALSIPSTVEALTRWQTELRARRWFLPLSALGILLSATVIVWLCLPSPPCVGPVCPSPVVHDLLVQLWTPDFVLVVLLLGVAFVLKRVFIDYLADVALYTTADENSTFFATRAAILKEATRRIRLLLHNDEYESLAIAGHSLGSVIAYDAINWLRTEAELPRRAAVPEALAGLAELVTKLPTAEAEKAKALVNQLERATAGETAKMPGDGAIVAARGLTVPVTAAEFRKLKTFVTFGSPLNKVLYFFRTRLKVYETIRGHITQDLHGFRQRPDLLSRDPSIVHDLTPVLDQLRWVNIYSPMDPVSARLQFYDRVHEHRRWFLVWGASHVSYWHDRKFYREVLAALKGECAWEASGRSPSTRTSHRR